MKKIKLIETQCDCEICSRMCQAPCVGLVDETEKLIELGYADRLMLDDDPEDIHPQPLIKPALKGFEGKRAPYETSSPEGCTFWRDGKCELHDKGLKPFLGRYAYHDASREHSAAVCEKALQSWKTQKAQKLISKFKKMMNIKERS